MSTKLLISIFCLTTVVFLASVFGSEVPTQCPADETNNTECPESDGETNTTECPEGETNTSECPDSETNTIECTDEETNNTESPDGETNNTECPDGETNAIECPEGERNETCPSKDKDADYCPLSDPSKKGTATVCDQPRCVCGFNQRRSRENGTCISVYDCPEFKCFGPNEVPNNCPVPCDPETCEDYINNSTCPKFGRIGIVVTCQPKCVCKKGYYKDGADCCILASQCPKQSS